MLSLSLLQRVTPNNKRILYIDGLRFFAVISVFICHYIDFYSDHYKNFQSYAIADYEYLGLAGVCLFFSISGFIIAVPFIQQHVYHDGNVRLKDYFLRRLTRLEPPYIILLSGFFILQVFVFRTKSFEFLFPHFLASLFYVHNVIYEAKPLINPVLWTLEIEIQFYILAPFFALIFKFNKMIRRIILVTVILFWDKIMYAHLDFQNLLSALPFFITGFLAADLFLDYKDKLSISLFFDFCCIISLLVLFSNYGKFPLLVSSFFLLAVSSKTVYFIKLVEHKILYIVGGMCYSIYMLHQKIIYLISPVLLSKKPYFNNYVIDFLTKLIITTAIVLVISSIFFILVERPTMKRQWWKYKSLRKLFFE